MCRKNQLLGIGLLAFGLGLLASGCFESRLFCWVLTIGCLIAGLLTLQKN